jgi:Tfp pilus assembly PilM family ATPase
LAGKQFTQAIANVMNMTYDEAENLKVQLGLPNIDGTPSPVPGITDETAQVARQALERETNRFIAEVRRSLDYYLTQATQVRTIKRIILTGSGSLLRNLPNYLEKGLQTQVILGDPLARVGVASGVEQAALSDRMGCAPAIGLALGGAD